MGVHNGHGAPKWYHPKKNDPLNAELNRNAEVCRCVVEWQFGRIGTMFNLASDDAGPWHHVGNGGHHHEQDPFASDRGMAKGVMYFEVCARLTAMTQRMRDSYPRKPHQFLTGKYEEWELAHALEIMQRSKQ